jgi:hypothetical protein
MTTGRINQVATMLYTGRDFPRIRAALHDLLQVENQTAEDHAKCRIRRHRANLAAQLAAWLRF